MTDTPDRIGRYEILGELGHGGMGVVYKGRDPAIDRLVALKLIKIDQGAGAMEERELRERFLIEARAAGKMVHPNIVTVYDVGDYQGQQFMAMEYLQGRDLSEILSARGAMEPEQAARVVRQVAEGLGYAHEAGIVHRDIKPGNIIIDTKGRAKITDFGLARLQASGSVTQTGHAVGSPSYMSPEQVQGKPVDGRSDIFSLGVMFYELLTGGRPFDGESLTAIIFKIVQEEPSWPSQIRPQIPAAFDRVVRRMMAKELKQRYATCEELIADLDRAREEASFAAVADGKTTMEFPSAEVTVDFDSSSLLSTGTPGRGRSIVTVFLLAAALLAAAGGGWWLTQPQGGKEIAATPPTPLPEQATAEEAQVPLTVLPGAPGGVITIDGAEAGTGKIEQGTIAAGRHQVRIEVPGYEPVEEEVTAVPGRELRLAPALTLASRSLRVTSRPAGAVVTVDGRKGGETPVVLPDLKVGSYQVEVSREGFAAERRSVEITGGKAVDLAVTLVNNTGELTVTGPKGAVVTVEGKKVGQAPLTRKLSEGSYRVAVSLAGHRTHAGTVTLERGKKLALEPSLPALGVGALKATAIPWADVFVNGRKEGTTPLTLGKVYEGSVSVRLVNPAFRPYEEKVQVRPGATATVSHRFTDAESTASSGGGSGDDGAGKGSLAVTSRPAGTLYLDGTRKGNTPVTIPALPVGEHEVVIKRSGMPDYRRKVQVVEGIVTRLAVE